MGLCEVENRLNVAEMEYVGLFYKNTIYVILAFLKNLFFCFISSLHDTLSLIIYAYIGIWSYQ